MTSDAVSAQLLGACALHASTSAGGSRRLLGPGKLMVLLVRLMHAPKGMSRDALTAFLWPAIGEVRAKSSLRQALFRLNEVLGPGRFAVDRQHVTLVSAIESDVRCFLSALDARDDAAAVAAYRGPFLADLSLADAGDAEQWITLERSRYLRLFLRAARREAARLLVHGQTDDALALLTRVRDDAPDELLSWTQLLDALERAGDPIAVQREVIALRVRVEADTGIDRSAAGRLIARVEAQDSWAPTQVHYGGEETSIGAVASHPPFVGRQEEIAHLQGLWADARRMQGRRVLVRGHAGVGKSRLLEEFVHSPRTDGALVLWIRARRGGRDDALAFLAELMTAMAALPGSMGVMQETAAALVSLVPSLVRQFPGAHWRVQPVERDQALTAAMRDLLATLADEQPLLLILDDLHWVDAASVAIIHDATSSLDGVAACVIAATRPRRDPFGDSWDLLRVSPFTEEHLRSFVQEIAGVRIERAVVDTLLQVAAGHPLQTLQAIRLFLTRGTIERHEDAWTLASGPASAHGVTAQDLLAAIIAEQSVAGRRLLTYLALADAPVPAQTLHRLVAGAARTEDVLRALDAADLASPVDGDQWRIGHDLVADLVVHQATAALRRELSLDLALQAEEGTTTLAELRRVVRWYLDADAPDAMIHAVRRWRKRTGHGPKGAVLADLLLGTGVTPRIRARLIRAVPERSRATGPIVASGLATAVCLMAIVWIWLHRPAHLVLVNQPTYLGSMGTQPTLEIRDRLGQLTTALDGAPLRLVQHRGADSITGIPLTPIREGMVVLDSMRIWRTDQLAVVPLQAVVAVATLPPLTITLTSQISDSLWLEAGVLNRQILTPREPTLRIRPGDRITGWIRARYSVSYGGVLVMLAQYTNWRDPQSDTLSLTSLLVPAQRAYYQAPRVDLPGPSRPGTYWLMWTYAAEPAAVWIASSTSWRCGVPVWTDGNEKGRMPPAAFAAAWGTGRTTFRKLLCEVGLPSVMDTQSVPAMAIKVIVE